MKPSSCLSPTGPLFKSLFSVRSLMLCKRECAQVEREAAKVNERHGWFKEGDAWGYRRNAYRQMAELLGGPAQHAYQTVFAREPQSTRHITQDLTPKLKAPITPKIFVQ